MLTETYTMQDVAKIVGIGEYKLFEQLRGLRVLNNKNIPYQRYIDAGYFRVITSHWHHKHAGLQYYAHSVVTARGIEWIKKIVGEVTTVAGRKTQNQHIHDRHRG